MLSSSPNLGLEWSGDEVGCPSGVASGLIGPVGLELRQVSGLTAGVSQPVSARGVQYTGGRNGTGFRLDADADGEIVITPTGAMVRLDDRLIDGPTRVGDAVIELGHASFILTQRRPPRRLGVGVVARRGVGLADSHDDDAPPAESVVEIPRSNLSDREVVDRVRAAHRDAVRHHRRAWPDPEELMFQAVGPGERVWSRPATHPLFGQIACAHTSLPWSATLSRPIQVSTRCNDAVQVYQSLPAVPMVADVSKGPLGLVGHREDTLAAARQIVLNLAVLSPPSDLQLTVVGTHRCRDDWDWMGPLPHVAPVDAPSAHRRVVTIMDHAGGIPDVHSVVIADDIDRLPADCVLVVIIGDDGTCTVLDHDRDVMTMGATPLGLDIGPAATAVRALREAEPLLRRRQRAAPERATTPTRRGEVTGFIRQLALTTRPARTDFRRPPIGATPIHYGYEGAFF